MTDLRLDLDALVGPVEPGEAVWAMVLRQHRRAGFGRLHWLARWRRFRRRRAGRRPARVSLHLVGGRVDLMLRGECIASRRYSPDPKELT